MAETLLAVELFHVETLLEQQVLLAGELQVVIQMVMELLLVVIVSAVDSSFQVEIPSEVDLLQAVTALAFLSAAAADAIQAAILWAGTVWVEILWEATF